MADITYHEQEEQHNLDLIRNVCNDLPDYVKRFVRGVQQTTSPRTRLGYVRDIKIFFEFLRIHFYFCLSFEHFSKNAFI